jgi:phage I-like protein
MVTHPLPSLRGLALNFESGAVPDWVQLTPPGPAIVGRDGRAWTLSDPAAVAAAFDPAKEPQIDLEHSSQIAAPQGLPAPAVGWIKELNVRDGALWGRVEWTAEGEANVTSRAYRYLSPVMAVDKKTGEILRIVSAGLTNSPNLEMAALNRATTETDMDKAVLDALGLTATATAADAVLAINALKSDKALALNRAEAPDPERFVPKADHVLALNRITAFEAEAKARREAEITAAVDAAVTAGKVAPASRDYHLAACRQDGGLERFTAMVAASPVIAGASGLDGRQPEEKALALNVEQKAADIAARAGVYQAEMRQKGVDVDIVTAVNHVEKKSR